MSVLKIAGKDPNANVKGVAVSADGHILTDVNGSVTTRKQWQTTEMIALDTTVADTSWHSVPESVDLGSAGLVSLRINNATSRDMTIAFYSDAEAGISPSKGMLSPGDDSIVIPATKLYIVTPADLPLLNYLHILRLRYQAASAPADETDAAKKLVVVVVTKE